MKIMLSFLIFAFQNKKIILSTDNNYYMKPRKLALIFALFFVSSLVFEACSSNKPNCGNKRHKKAQHARTKKMVGSGWVQ